MMRKVECESVHDRPIRRGSPLSPLAFPASFGGRGLITEVIVGPILLIHSG